jgi:hypothetical protein
MVGLEPVALEDLTAHFPPRAGDTADVRRQAVHVEAGTLGGAPHHGFVAVPVLVAGVFFQALLLQGLQSGLVRGTQQLGAAPGDPHRRPRLGVDDLGALKSFGHIMRNTEGAAARRGLLSGQVDHLGQQLVALGVGQRHVHPEARQEADQALRHGERLAVARRVSPGDDELPAAQPVEPAEAALEVQQVGQRLGRVIDIALKVDDRRPARQYALLVAFLQGGGELAHIAVALAEVNVVADADGFGQERDHDGRLAHRLAVGDLRLGLVEVGERQPQGARGRGEAEARARGLVAEDRDGQPGVEGAHGAAGVVKLAQGLGRKQDRADLIQRMLPSQQEVAVSEIGPKRGQFS